MKNSAIALSIVLLLQSVTVKADAPKGFEDPALLARVMKGEIVSEIAVETKLERKVFLKAFFSKTDANAYMKLATDHPKYPDLFEEIVEGRTTKVSADKTQYEWYMDLLFPYGPLTLHVYPEGKQVLKHAVDAVSESTVSNAMTNYTDMVQFATQNTRLIPYEGGMLVEDSIHVKMLKDNSQTAAVKKELLKQFTRFIDGFRKALKAVP